MLAARARAKSTPVTPARAKSTRAPYYTLAAFPSPAPLCCWAAEFYTGIEVILQAQHAPHVQLLRDLHREETRLRECDCNPFPHEPCVLWDLLTTVEQPEHPDWREALHELERVLRSWATDYTGDALTATEDFLADMWYNDHDDDMPSEPRAWRASMAALRAEHIEPAEAEYWAIRDSVKTLLHRLRAALNGQCAGYARF